MDHFNRPSRLLWRWLGHRQPQRLRLLFLLMMTVVLVRAATTTSNVVSNDDDPEDDEDMNIVLLYADDWSWRTIGAMTDKDGNTDNVVRTPNIDRIAQNGVMFTRNCVTSSVCWQSRASLITGQYTAVHRQFKILSDALLQPDVWPRTLYPLLKKNGYDVGFVGKWHAPMYEPYQRRAFNYFRSYYGSHWLERDGRLRHVTELNGADALEYLRRIKRNKNKQGEERRKKKKFALTVSFFATHSWDGMLYPDQYQPQKYTEDMYNSSSYIPVPKTATEQAYRNLPLFLQGPTESQKRWLQRYNTPSRYQVTMKRILRMAKEVDDIVGDIVAELKSQGLYDNTLLVFTTDNGVHRGAHRLAGKWWPYEEAIRVPLVIQDPRMSRKVRGTTVDDITLNIDLAPTLLSAAGIPVPSEMQGADLSRLYLRTKNAGTAGARDGDGNADTEASTLRRNLQELQPEQKTPWRTDFFYEWNTGNPVDASDHSYGDWIPPVFGLVGREYKYFYWPHEKMEQIFHVSRDPFEERDVFPDMLQNNETMVRKLRQRYTLLKQRSQNGFPA